MQTISCRLGDPGIQAIAVLPRILPSAHGGGSNG